MNFVSVVLISVLTSSAHTSWIRNLTSSRGLSFGDGMFLQLEDSKAKNSSLLERVSLKIDNKDMGIRLGQNTDKNAVEVDFFLKDQFEGRSKKMGNMVFPFMVGAAGAGAMSVMVGAVKLMVLKSIIVAKVALLLSIILIIGKLMHGKSELPSHVEVEEHGASEVYPVYSEYSNSGADSDYGTSPDGGGYTNGGYGGYYVPSAAAESALSYATVEASAGNATIAGPGVQRILPAGRRRDYARLKAKYSPTILTIRRYS